jgi:hypothetical protein
MKTDIRQVTFSVALTNENNMYLGTYDFEISLTTLLKPNGDYRHEPEIISICSGGSADYVPLTHQNAKEISAAGQRMLSFLKRCMDSVPV